MKKLLIALAVAFVASAGIFAQMATGPFQGTWYDKQYNVNWVFSVSNSSNVICELRDAPTDALIFQFTKDNVENFKESMDAGTNANKVSWDCAEKRRKYEFTRQVGYPDIKMSVYHTYYSETHTPMIIKNGYEATK